ncbi:hypothetical protein Lal_00043971 [Lupinus albus]|nr:hypothetical protein Lal_00043971 [Lupinus albus]
MKRRQRKRTRRRRHGKSRAGVNIATGYSIHDPNLLRIQPLSINTTLFLQSLALYLRIKRYNPS